MNAGVSTRPCASSRRAAPRGAVAMGHAETSSPSLDQHRVAVGEEAVALARSHAHRPCGYCPCRRTRETSISSVDFGRWKLVSRRFTTRNRKPGVMKRSVSPSSLPLSACGFQRPQRGRADGEHAPPFDRLQRFERNRVALAVHAVLFDFVDAHRLEGAGADVQGDFRDCGAAAHRSASEYLRRNAGPRSARRRRRGCGVHRLVALGVVGARRVPDVGRQRHAAVALEHRVDRFAKNERDTARRRAPRPSPRRSSTKTCEPAAGGWLARMSASASRSPSDALDEQLDLAAARFAAGEARLDDARVVQHQRVVCVDELRQVGEREVLEAAGSRIQVQQAARAALRHGCWAMSSGGSS